MARHILMDGVEGIGNEEVQLLVVNKGGQHAWNHMLIQRFEEFDYIQDLDIALAHSPSNDAVRPTPQYP